MFVQYKKTVASDTSRCEGEFAGRRVRSARPDARQGLLAVGRSRNPAPRHDLLTAQSAFFIQTLP
jgi:hypothetical protein